MMFSPAATTNGSIVSFGRWYASIAKYEYRSFIFSIFVDISREHVVMPCPAKYMRDTSATDATGEIELISILLWSVTFENIMVVSAKDTSIVL